MRRELLVDMPERITHNDFICIVQLSVTASLVDNASFIKELFFNLFKRIFQRSLCAIFVATNILYVQ